MMNWIRRRYRFSRWARIVKILCTVVLAVLAFVVGKQTYPLWSQDARSLIIIFWPFMVMMIILRIFFVGEDWEDFKSELIKYGITPILAGVLSYAVADATSFGSSIGSFLGTLFMTALFGLIGIPVGVILGFAIGSMFQPVVGNSFKAEKKKLLKEKQNINFEKNLSAVKNPDRTKLLLYHFL